ncbi:N-acetylmuramoyl-L-alanine amidase-like domain-containing protein [Nocardia neocaledoniensis]|uniref:N-acetylmuramoyl-L-alanine amidase-like domain-containing protein n=1 Tax=Nocardia neocaledoniensis TaxID=236511 RepID=UPI002457CF96|nr:N-acetylmuramoyl-L-alanine amidase-like domain-containing protein [Nocardia neocaledoniensis]
MRIIVPILFVLAALLGATAPASAAPTLDDTTSRKIDELLAVRAEAGDIDRGELLARLGARLLDTPYGANMLVGSATEREQLVIDLRRVDCFTYLDYLEAASRSGDRDQFVANLLATRYVDSRVEFAQRKHFFTDWAATGRRAATDITATLSPAAVTVTKHLNAKGDGGTYLPGIPVVDRAVTHIPAAAVDGAVLAGLRTGDFLGAYSPDTGLDVTHVGLVVHTPGGPVFRNASSLAEYRVVDTPLADYVRTTPGIVVLRPV